MTESSGSKGFLSARLVRKIGVLVAIGLLLLVAWGSAASGFWPFLHGFTWRGEVSVMRAELRSPDTLALSVASCNGDPEVDWLRETDAEVEIMVTASSTPFRGGGDDCGDVLVVQLQEPFGDRTLVDKHTGRVVDVTGGVSVREEVDLYLGDLISPERFVLDINMT